MNRRQAVQRVSLLLGGTILGAELLVQNGCKPVDNKKVAVKPIGTFFSKDEITLLDEVAETIIPRTDTPGAKDAAVGAFINVMVRDCYTDSDQKIFKTGLKTLQQECKEKYRADFLKISAVKQKEFISEIHLQEIQYHNNKKEGDPTHYFRMLRELTVLGYFTSEPGATKALRYIAVPGKYEPCIEYKYEDKAWAL